MPALAPLTIDDREDTPVSHTFNPHSLADGVATFLESDGSPIGDNKVTVSLRKTNDGRWKAKVVLAMPVVVTETINGVDRQKVERTAYVDVQTTFANDSTEQERENAVGLMANALSASQSVMNPILVNLQALY